MHSVPTDSSRELNNQSSIAWAAEGTENAEKRPILAVIVFMRSDLDEYTCINALVTV